MNRVLKIILILIFTTMVLIMRESIINPPSTLHIKYVHYDEFEKLGYQSSDLKILQTFMSKIQLEEIINKQISREVLFSYLKYRTFIFDDIEDYEKIRTTKYVTHQAALNIKHHPYMMSQFYKKTRDAINLNNTLTLVNKNYALKKDYVPSDLVYTKDINMIIKNDFSRNRLKKSAYLALKTLFEAAEKENLYLYLSNGYRSYEKQEKIYHHYKLTIGNADFFSARAGHSEHQTGLAVDITCKEVDFQLVQRFANTKEGQYVKNNAHRYGFIIRYPKDKENTHGYHYEPWHLRYVGTKAATIIHQKNLTLEEYLINYTVMPI
ncbi:M15 family metallopeptidase [Mycoplasmatota bacterium]|nr:M15 family metallopeptidase [Mycoplasmatota bacterium]